MNGGDRVTAEVRALEALDLEGVRAAWRARYGAPPRLRSPQLLRRMLAWRIQAHAFGDGGAELRRLLRADPKHEKARGPALPPGSRLTREWRGVTHEVAVTAEGFLHQGVTYRSLSKVAFAITGVKWNGPRFFGLRADSA